MGHTESGYERKKTGFDSFHLKAKKVSPVRMSNRVTRLGEFSHMPWAKEVFFGQIFEKYKSRPTFWVTFIHGKSYILCNFDKKWFVSHLARFFSTNSSGHPDGE
jgi:hypothetical protein